MSQNHNKTLNVIYFNDGEQNFGCDVPQTPGFLKRDKKAACGFTTVATPQEATAYPRLVAIFHAILIRTRYQGSHTRLAAAPSPSND